MGHGFLFCVVCVYLLDVCVCVCVRLYCFIVMMIVTLFCFSYAVPVWTWYLVSLSPHASFWVRCPLRFPLHLCVFVCVCLFSILLHMTLLRRGSSYPHP